MGLDMFARTLDKRPETATDFEVPDGDAGKELFYWRKHPDLHGWMEQLYRSKGGGEDFNVVPVLLEAKDLDDLEKAIEGRELPPTSGFFFGSSDPSRIDDDRQFIAKARAAMAEGKFVYYSSWW